MTVHYTFTPFLVDASPIPSRFAAPLDAMAGVVWLEGEPRPDEQSVYSQRVSCERGTWHTVIMSLSLRDIDLILRPRRRGQRPAGMPRSAWWRLRRGERRQIGGAP